MDSRINQQRSHVRYIVENMNVHSIGSQKQLYLIYRNICPTQPSEVSGTYCSCCEDSIPQGHRDSLSCCYNSTHNI